MGTLKSSNIQLKIFVLSNLINSNGKTCLLNTRNNFLKIWSTLTYAVRAPNIQCGTFCRIVPCTQFNGTQQYSLLLPRRRELVCLSLVSWLCSGLNPFIFKLAVRVNRVVRKKVKYHDDRLGQMNCMSYVTSRYCIILNTCLSFNFD